MYHPAAALHQPALKLTVERDFSHLEDVIQKQIPARPEKVEQTFNENDPKDNTSQLSFF